MRAAASFCLLLLLPATPGCEGGEGSTSAGGGTAGVATGGGSGGLGSSSGSGGLGSSGGSGGQAGSGFEGEASCVGNVVWAKPFEQSYAFTATVVDLASRAPVVGATVRVCAIGDLGCGFPLLTKTTDALGQAKLSAPSSTSGVAAYLDIDGAGTLRTLEFLRFTDNTTLHNGAVTVSVMSAVTFAAFQSQLQVTSDPARGHVIFTARDCFATPLSGVSTSLSPAHPSSVPIYSQGLAPSKTATATDGTGVGGHINVPVGPVTLTGKSAKNGATLGKVELFVRAGCISQSDLPPTP